MNTKPNPFRYYISAWDSTGSHKIMHAGSLKGLLSQYNSWLNSVNGKMLRPKYHTILAYDCMGEKLLDLSNTVNIEEV